MTSTVLHPMAWTNDKVPIKCMDNIIGLRQLWKMIALDNNNTSKNKLVLDSDNLAEFLSNRGLLQQNKMSLLKFLAINALELSAPAAPVLLQQGSNNKTNNWVQLSGHPQSIVPAASGIVRKRISGPTDSEVKAYQAIKSDPNASKLVPKFLGIKDINGENYIELQDLLYGFKDPNVMDIKMGCRTFSETEVTNQSLRSDLYKKMIAVDSSAPTAEEHQLQAITKLRYMLFREKMSSSQSKGFRIEALRIRGGKPVTDLKTMKTDNQIQGTILNFLNDRKSVTKELIKRLKQMRQLMEKSEFFRTHEIIGSSIFIVYDDEKVGVWLIDFAKSRELPSGQTVDHRKEWIPGNCEEGLLRGMDELIKILENIYECQAKSDRIFSRR